MKRATYLNFVLIFFILFNVHLQTSANPVQWSFQTGDKIYSSPVIADTLVLIGSNDGNLYALGANSGQKVWQFNTNSSIRSNPLVFNNIVYITSANILFALHIKDGTELWKFSPKEAEGKTAVIQIDEWDYHQSSPVLYNNLILYGDEYGNMHGINCTSGKEDLLFQTESKAAIRITALVEQNTIYFGDWDGIVYAVDLTTRNLLWSYHTYEKREYGSFGPIVGQPVLHQNKLIFGARNYNFFVLNSVTGSLEWTHKDNSGGWISGFPVVSNDTLYIGGSDNKTLFAFNPDNGKLHWQYKSEMNIFSKPFIYNNLIMYTDGDSYNHVTGKGYIYILRKSNGKPLNIIKGGRNIYSSPLLANGHAYFGSFDGKLYCYDLNKLAGKDLKPKIELNCTPLNLGQINDTKLLTTKIAIKNNGELMDSAFISLKDLDGKTVEGVIINREKIRILPSDSQVVELKIYPDYLQNRKYELSMTVNSKIITDLKLSKQISFNILKTVIKKVDDSGNIRYYFDTQNSSLICNIPTKDASDVKVNIYDQQGRLVHKYHNLNHLQGENAIIVNLREKLRQGLYIFLLIVNNQKFTGKFLVATI